MRRIALLPALALLAACASPAEQCIANSTRDLRVVDKLIVETQGNLQRGYAWEEVTTYKKSFVDCTPKPTPTTPEPKSRMCLVDEPVVSRKAVAIDLKAEKAKLDGLQAKRVELARAADRAATECRARYPE